MRAFEVLQTAALEYRGFLARRQKRDGSSDDDVVYVGKFVDGTIGLVVGGIWASMTGTDARDMARYILSLYPPPGEPFDPPRIGKQPGSSATGSIRHT